MSFRRWFFSLALLAVSSSSSLALPLYSGTIAGTFDDPVLTGFTINLMDLPVFWDNTSSAVISGVGTNTFSWGDEPSFSGISESTLTFSGSTFTDVRPFLPGSPGDVFELGTLTYTNGTSLFDTVAFGITLNIEADVESAMVTPASIDLGFIATSGPRADPIDAADFVTLSVGGVDIGKTFHIFEESTASTILLGRIVGDPVLEFVDIVLAPGETGGFIRSRVPEPATALLMGVALAGFGFYGRRLNR